MVKSTRKTPFKEIAMVWWQDAYTEDGDNPHLSNGDHLTISIGVIVETDKNFIYVSHFYEGINQSMSSPYTVIPLGMVKHIERIKTN